MHMPCVLALPVQGMDSLENLISTQSGLNALLLPALSCS